MKDFSEFIGVLQRYAESNKTFVVNDIKMAEVKRAFNLAIELFPDASIYMEHDALQLGHVALHIKDFDITVCGQDRIDMFIALISKSANFEIFASGEDVKFSLMFGNVYTVK